MRYSSIVSLIVFFVSLVSAEFFPPTSVWENVQYVRAVDLSRSYVKENHLIKIKNILSEPSQVYYFAIPTDLKESVSIFLPTVDKNGQRRALIATELDESSNELSFFKIQLPFPIAPKLTVDFQVSIVFTNQLQPLPAEVDEIKDMQSLVFYTNKLPISVYPTEKYELRFAGFQSTVDELPIAGVSELAFEKFKGSQVKDQLVYGPFDLSNEEPLAQVPMSLLYNRLSPLLLVNKLTRDVWISHWSELLQVEEHYELTNKGVSLKNGFNRVEYMKKRMALKLNPSINSLEIPLYDSDTTEIYYTDLVGNVSTSMVLEDSLVLKPRFPIFGGWNYNFTIGWTNPLSKYVHHSQKNNEEFILRVPMVSGPRDCTYAELDFNVYLPAGAKILEVECPVEYDGYTIDEFYSYLDTLKGHTRVSLKFDNIVDEMKNVQVIIKYGYTTVDMLSKVISISSYILIALLSFIGIKLIDIRIDVNKKK